MILALLTDNDFAGLWVICVFGLAAFIIWRVTR